jgi:hypothetical protein
VRKEREEDALARRALAKQQGKASLPRAGVPAFS